MSMSRFISLWTHPESTPDPVGEDELDAVEARLRTRLPADYREAMIQSGLPRLTIDLLGTIVDRQLDVRDVNDFLPPAEIVTLTEAWRELGLPEELVAFATDCVGNLYCFPTGETEGRSQPVFFFDHENREVEAVAPSFAAWIDEFCGLSPH